MLLLIIYVINNSFKRIPQGTYKYHSGLKCEKDNILIRMTETKEP